MKIRLLSACALSVLFFTSFCFCQEQAQKYGSQPGGVVLEGRAEGVEDPGKVVYDRQRNVFITGKGIVYRPPLESEEVVSLLAALLQDDRLGVSLTLQDEELVYGVLDNKLQMVKSMLETDRLLGGVTFAVSRYLKGKTVPGGYKPLKPGRHETPLACCYIFEKFVFTLRKNKSAAPSAPRAEIMGEDNIVEDGGKEAEKVTPEYVRADFALTMLLVPLKKEKASDGGHLPDTEKADEKLDNEEVRKNMVEIEKNRESYFAIPYVAKTIAVAETAAFIRCIDRKRLTEIVKELAE